MSVRVHADPAFETSRHRDGEPLRDDGAAASLARVTAGAGAAPGRLPGYQVLPGRNGPIIARQTPPSGFPGATAAPAADPGLADLFSDFGIGMMRTGLEGVRLIPGLGAIGGLAADGLEIFQDFRTISGEEAPVMKGLLAARGALIVVNGLAGHFALVFEEVQDAAVASVFGAEVAIITAPLIEVDKELKLGLDTLQILTDATVAFGAYTQAMGATGESREQWMKLGWGYCANVVGDVLTTAVDLWDASTLGFGNGEVVKRLMTLLGGLLKTVAQGVKLIRAALLGLFNVWDDTIMQPPKPDEGLDPLPGSTLARSATAPATPGQSRRAAGDAALAQIAGIQGCWQTGDDLLAAGDEALHDQIEAMKLQAAELEGSKDPFTTLRDGGMQMLDELDKRLGAMTKAMDMSGTAGEQADSLRATIDRVLGKIDAIKVPEIDVGHVDLGTGAVAGAVEGVVNAGADLADAGADAIVAKVQQMVDGAKTAARAPLESVREQADEIVAGMELMRQELGPQLEEAQKLASETRTKLGQCSNAGDVIDVLVEQIGESVGVHEDFGVADARTAWASVGSDIGAAQGWATQLRDSDGRAAPKPPGLSPEPPMPPAPPDAGDQPNGKGGG